MMVLLNEAPQRHRFSNYIDGGNKPFQVASNPGGNASVLFGLAGAGERETVGAAGGDADEGAVAVAQGFVSSQQKDRLG